MATYGPRPYDTTDFAQVKKPEGPETPPWAREDEAGTSRPKTEDRGSGLLFVGILVLLLLTGVSAVVLLMGWIKI